MFCDSLQHLRCFQLFLNINTYTIIHSKTHCFDRFPLKIRIVLMTPSCQYPHNSDNPSQNAKKYMFCNGLQYLCCFQRCLKINKNAVIIGKTRILKYFAYSDKVGDNTFSVSTISGVVMHCKTVRSTYFEMDYNISVVLNFFVASTLLL